MNESMFSDLCCQLILFEICLGLQLADESSFSEGIANSELLKTIPNLSSGITYRPKSSILHSPMYNSCEQQIDEILVIPSDASNLLKAMVNVPFVCASSRGSRPAANENRKLAIPVRKESHSGEIARPAPVQPVIGALKRSAFELKMAVQANASPWELVSCVGSGDFAALIFIGEEVAGASPAS
jgi:hypothetical protein